MIMQLLPDLSSGSNSALFGGRSGAGSRNQVGSGKGSFLLVRVFF